MHAILVFILAAILCAGAAFWALRAYRRANGSPPRALPALAMCGAVALSALALYLAIGRPDLPDAPYRMRMEALKQRDLASLTVEEALAILGEAARMHPADVEPHLYSGQLLLDSGRPQEAARAFDAALRRDRENVEALMGLGRALVQVDDGRISPQALALFEAAGAGSADPAPFLYQAMAAMQRDDAAGARQHWSEALARMAPDDPRRAMAQRMIAETGR
jgi:cytochrome c-type biogenesis protein CcmH